MARLGRHRWLLPLIVGALIFSAGNDLDGAARYAIGAPGFALLMVSLFAFLENGRPTRWTVGLALVAGIAAVWLTPLMIVWVEGLLGLQRL